MPRKILLATLTVTASTVFALIIGELFLVVYSGSQTANESMDPGLIRYHSRYGWTVTPGWQGRHQHVEYDVAYSISPRGFRHSGDKTGNARAVVVGDSFTFGLGVEDSDTWISQLNESTDIEWINAAVPGYSPEQSLLRARDLVEGLKPEYLFFVVYLGNDLIDLGLEYPVQADFAKPYAVGDGGNWLLRNQPVPATPKPDHLKSRTLSSYIVEPGTGNLLSSLKLGQLIVESGLAANPVNLNTRQIDYSLQLFEGVIDQLDAMDETTLTIVLLPGSGPVTRPHSLAAQYQGLLQQRINADSKAKDVKTISLLSYLQNAGEGQYFPLDGHLTAAGHRTVAAAMEALLLPKEGNHF